MIEPVEGGELNETTEIERLIDAFAFLERAYLAVLDIFQIRQVPVPGQFFHDLGLIQEDFPKSLGGSQVRVEVLGKEELLNRSFCSELAVKKLIISKASQLLPNFDDPFVDMWASILHRLWLGLLSEEEKSSEEKSSVEIFPHNNGSYKNLFETFSLNYSSFKQINERFLLWDKDFNHLDKKILWQPDFKRGGGARGKEFLKKIPIELALEDGGSVLEFLIYRQIPALLFVYGKILDKYTDYIEKVDVSGKIPSINKPQIIQSIKLFIKDITGGEVELPLKKREFQALIEEFDDFLFHVQKSALVTINLELRQLNLEKMPVFPREVDFNLIENEMYLLRQEYECIFRIVGRRDIFVQDYGLLESYFSDLVFHEDDQMLEKILAERSERGFKIEGIEGISNVCLDLLEYLNRRWEEMNLIFSSGYIPSKYEQKRAYDCLLSAKRVIDEVVENTQKNKVAKEYAENLQKKLGEVLSSSFKGSFYHFYLYGYLPEAYSCYTSLLGSQIKIPEAFSNHLPKIGTPTLFLLRIEDILGLNPSDLLLEEIQQLQIEKIGPTNQREEFWSEEAAGCSICNEIKEDPLGHFFHENLVKNEGFARSQRVDVSLRIREIVRKIIAADLEPHSIQDGEENIEIDASLYNSFNKISEELERLSEVLTAYVEENDFNELYRALEMLRKQLEEELGEVLLKRRQIKRLLEEVFYGAAPNFLNSRYRFYRPAEAEEDRLSPSKAWKKVLDEFFVEGANVTDEINKHIVIEKYLESITENMVNAGDAIYSKGLQELKYMIFALPRYVYVSENEEAYRYDEIEVQDCENRFW